MEVRDLLRVLVSLTAAVVWRTLMTLPLLRHDSQLANSCLHSAVVAIVAIRVFLRLNLEQANKQGNRRSRRQKYEQTNQSNQSDDK